MGTLGTRRHPAAIAAAAAITVLVVPGAAAVVRQDIIREREHGSLAMEHRNISDYLHSLGIDEGVAGYWDAHPLRYRTGLNVAAVNICADGHRFCPVRVNARASWYRDFDAPTMFVLINTRPATGFTEADAIRVLATAPRTRKRFATITVLTFDRPASQVVRPLT